MEDTLRDKIRAYLNGQMPEKESDAFRAEIQENDYLAAEVDLMRLEITMLDVVHEDWMRGKMKEWEENYQEETLDTTARKGFLRKYWVVLGGLVVVGILVALYVYLPKKEIPVATSFGDPVWLSYVFGDYVKPPTHPGNGPYNFTPKTIDTTVAIIPIKLPPPSYLTCLNRIIDDQRGNLNRMGNSNDWRYYLVVHEYGNAWKSLKEIVKTKEDITRKPEAFYYASLLKLYWDQKIDLDAVGILNQLEYSDLSYVIPRFKEEDLIRHRQIAHYLDIQSPLADSLIRILPDTNR